MRTQLVVVIGIAVALVVGISVPLVAAYSGAQGSQSYFPWMNNNSHAGYGMMGNYYNGGGMMWGGGMMNGAGFGMIYGNQYAPNGAWNYSQGNSPIVIIAGYSFNPSSMTIKAGTTVTWINMDMVAHTVTSGTERNPTNLFDSHELVHMQSFSYTFNTPGTYAYYCDFHPDMVATITVV